MSIAPALARLASVGLVAAVCASWAPCDVTYDAARDCICVTDFTEDDPATMDAVLAADRESGWGKVTYDAATDTYTVAADLWIGDDQSNGTFFQMGYWAHPAVTVIVKGTVWVRPPKESPPRSDGLPSIISRLTLGDPEDERIRATLKIACESPGEHGVYVGYRGPDAWSYGGALYVYNSTITAATQNKEHVWGVRDYTDEGASPRWSSPGWYCSDLQLTNATISWFEGCVTYGIETGEIDRGQSVDAMRANPLMTVEATTFEHGAAAVRNNRHYLKDCVFQDLQVAVAEGGSLSAKLVNCTFEGNRWNFTLGSVDSGGIVMLDCTVGPQEEPILINSNRIEPEKAAAQGVPIYPACLLRESLVLKVVDAGGNPVPDAMIVVSCREAPEQVTCGATVTDDRGMTPSDPEGGAIVITVKRYRATDVPEEPEVATFSYDIAVTVRGFKPKTVALPAGQEIARPLVIELQE